MGWFHEKSLRSQLVMSLLGASIPMIALTFIVVLITANIVGSSVRTETTNALDAQIKRHLLSASSEISAATTKRFKVVEASLLDPVAYALRDGMANNMPLSNGGRGYPLGYPENLDSWDFPPPPAPNVVTPGQAGHPGRNLGDYCGVTAPTSGTYTETRCTCVNDNAPCDTSAPGYDATVGCGRCSECRKTNSGNGNCVLVSNAVDMTRTSIWYAQDGSPNVGSCTDTATDTSKTCDTNPATDGTASCPVGCTGAVSDATQRAIERSAAIDHWLPALYERHTAVQTVYVGLRPCNPANMDCEANQPGPCTGTVTCSDWSLETPAFRQYPGHNKADEVGSKFGCSDPKLVTNEGVAWTSYQSNGYCYDAAVRGWYRSALSKGQERCTGSVGCMGKAILSSPYQDAGSGDWMVTMAKAVYSEDSVGTAGFIGVIGIDMLLSAIRESIIDFQMLETGFAMLVDVRDKTIVAAPESIYHPCGETQALGDDGCVEAQDICELMPGVCNGDRFDQSCDALLARGAQDADADETTFNEITFDGKLLVWQGGCVETEQPGELTHAVLVLVPKDEIRRPVAGVTERWEETHSLTLTIVSILSASTLVLITIALFSLANVITKPIVTMSKVAGQISNSVFDDDEQGAVNTKKALDNLTNTKQKPDEIGDLLQEFIKMVSGLTNDGGGGGGPAADPAVTYPPNPLLGEAMPSAPTASAPTAVVHAVAVEEKGRAERQP